jgi:hypothetical protein
MQNFSFPTKQFSVFFLLLTLFSSCATYGPAFKSQESSIYLERPMMQDSQKVAQTYLQAQVSSGAIYQTSDVNNLLRVGIHRGIAMNYFQATFGAFAFGGKYKVANINQDKNFWGLGVRAGCNLALKTGENSEIMPFGLDISVNSETGSYYQFRKTLDSLDNDFTEISPVQLYFSIPFAYRFRVSNNTMMTIKYALGMGGESSSTSHSLTMSLNMNDKFVLQGFATLHGGRIKESSVINEVFGFGLSYGIGNVDKQSKGKRERR